jgi:hypothetical protein
MTTGGRLHTDCFRPVKNRLRRLGMKTQPETETNVTRKFSARNVVAEESDSLQFDLSLQ